MRNRELVMLAQDFEYGKHRTAGMMVSEKMDGMRAVWVPETLGLMTTEVPWANMAGRARNVACTGLWSRYGNPIMAPAWFTAGWPRDIMLDGELWGGRGKHQSTMSAVRKDEPVESEWEGITYMVFDRPPREQFYRDGRINNANYKKTFSHMHPVVARDPRPYADLHTEYRFLMRDIGVTGDCLRVHKQTILSFATEAANTQLDTMLREVTEGGGEGLVIRYTGSKWQPVRSAEILKLKPLRAGAGVVTHFTSGLGKHQGRLGSVGVLWGSVQFDLAGFTDAERALSPISQIWADDHPGQRMPDSCVADCFDVGDGIQFEYRELTDDGKPKEARYKR